MSTQPKSRKFQHRATAVLTIASLISIGLLRFASSAVADSTPVANTTCPAGTTPIDIGASNTGFSGPPTNNGTNVPVGQRLTTPGVTYTMPGGGTFKSQARNETTSNFNIYPGDNSFSIQTGDRNLGFAGLNQKAFPGDPANNVPAVPNWFYSNGNWFGTQNYDTAISNDVTINGEYLLWQQDITIPNWVAGKTYVFFAYVSNVIEIPANDAPDDPIVRLRTAGTDGLPDGTLLSGPFILQEGSGSYLQPSVAALGVNTANSAPLNGWYRVSGTIQPTSNTARLKFTSSATGGGGDDFGLTQINLYECRPISSNPNLLLVKRITKINNQAFMTYKQEDDNPYDDNVLEPNLAPNPQTSVPHYPTADTTYWPGTNGKTDSTFLIGEINGVSVKPNDSIEYTIYFLSTGTGPANNVLFCDRVPTNVTFLPTAFNSLPADSTGLGGADRGIVAKLGTDPLKAYTNIADGDFAQYFPPNVEPSTVYPKINCGGPNVNGAVVVKLGNLNNATSPGQPPESYGFVRFQGVVK
jgi:uncharacterized repeat protein (TIGR01451 family)